MYIDGSMRMDYSTGIKHYRGCPRLLFSIHYVTSFHQTTYTFRCAVYSYIFYNNLYPGVVNYVSDFISTIIVITNPRIKMPLLLNLTISLQYVSSN